MQKTWGDIITEARAEMFPFPGEAKPQIASHTKYFHLAAMDLQHWIPELQVNNAKVYPFCSTYFECGKTIVDAPIGLVQRVYTIATDKWCDRVPYQGAAFCEVECWSKNLLNYTVPDNTGMEKLPMGFRFADASSDSVCGRARVGIWARHNHRLYVAPWIQSNESLIVEWDGIKKEWDENDLLNTELWDDRVINAIKMFVKWYHEKFHGCDVEAKLNAERDFKNERADLIHYFQEITRAKDAEACCEQRIPTKAERDDDADTLETDTVFAIMGDYGEDDADSASVATLIKSWDPLYVVSNGDNWYGSSTSLANWELLSAKNYRDYIFPYRSYQDPKLVSAATKNNFYVTIGNHDRDPVGHLAIELALFNVPSVFRDGAEQPSNGYYQVVRGHMEHFFYDSGYDNSHVNQQADGNDLNSKQAVWLQTALARSTARWKWVHIHHPGYTSTLDASPQPTLVGDGYKNFIAIRNIVNKLKEWGADGVSHGHSHNYERMNVNGLPVVLNGVGGQNIVAFGTPRTWSIYRYNAKFGAQKCTVNCDTLKMEFYDVDGVLHDTLLLTK